MAYFTPQITAAGLSTPKFSDIQEALISAYKAAYGSTVYLGNDSADYQWISAVALKLSDAMGLCVLAYNARSPLTAVGADLDSVVKINGIARLPSSASTVFLTLTGTPGTVITNGVIADFNGNLWSLPATVTIGAGGSVSVLATCQIFGAISADANTIISPVGGFTAGWTSVTNPSAAIIGEPPESDSSLRSRQSISVSLPSSTRLAATQAALLQVPGVVRVLVLENQTAVTDSYGNAGHSLTCVVQGGAAIDIATAIYNNRGIGCDTLGATATAMQEIDVTDPNTGNVTTIGYIIAINSPIYVSISVHGLNNSFTTATQTAIIAAIVNYLNSLAIGEEVTQSALYGAALTVISNLSQPSFSIRALTLGTAPSPSGTTDITLPFYEVAQGITANVILTVV